MAQWRQMSQIDLDAAVSEVSSIISRIYNYTPQIKHQNSPTENRKFTFPKRPDPIGSEALYCQQRSSSPTSGRPRIPSNSPDQSPVVKANPLRLGKPLFFYIFALYFFKIKKTWISENNFFQKNSMKLKRHLHLLQNIRL